MKNGSSSQSHVQMRTHLSFVLVVNSLIFRSGSLFGKTDIRWYFFLHQQLICFRLKPIAFANILNRRLVFTLPWKFIPRWCPYCLLKATRHPTIALKCFKTPFFLCSPISFKTLSNNLDFCVKIKVRTSNSKLHNAFWSGKNVALHFHYSVYLWAVFRHFYFNLVQMMEWFSHKLLTLCTLSIKAAKMVLKHQKHS